MQATPLAQCLCHTRRLRPGLTWALALARQDHHCGYNSSGIACRSSQRRNSVQLCSQDGDGWVHSLRGRVLRMIFVYCNTRQQSTTYQRPKPERRKTKCCRVGGGEEEGGGHVLEFPSRSSGTSSNFPPRAADLSSRSSGTSSNGQPSSRSRARASEGPKCQTRTSAHIIA